MVTPRISSAGPALLATTLSLTSSIPGTTSLLAGLHHTRALINLRGFAQAFLNTWKSLLLLVYKWSTFLLFRAQLVSSLGKHPHPVTFYLLLCISFLFFF